MQTNHTHHDIVVSGTPLLRVSAQLSSLPGATCPAVAFPSPPSSVSPLRELVFLVCDNSPSMDELYGDGITKKQAMIRATINTIINRHSIDPDDEVGLVLFDSDGYLIHELKPLRTHKQTLIRALQSLRTGNGTDIDAGLRTAGDHFQWARGGVVRRVFLITDGHGGDPLRTAAALLKRGVRNDVIGVGPNPSAVNEKLLKALASVVDGELCYRFISDQASLFDHYTSLASKTTMPL